MKKWLFYILLLIGFLGVLFISFKNHSSKSVFSPAPPCGFTPVLFSPSGPNMNTGHYVIQNQPQWVDANETPIMPAIHFSKQMMLEIIQNIRGHYPCSPVPPEILSVCFKSTSIEVRYKSGSTFCSHIPLTLSKSQTSPDSWNVNLSSVVIVPLSNLPVKWINQTPSPTPTPPPFHS